MGQYKGIMGGIDSMMSSRFTPWHYSYNQDRVKLVDLDITSGRQALTLAGCDWKVGEIKLDTLMPDHVNADSHKLLVREDQPILLGVQSGAYSVIQNEVTGDLADAILGVVDGSCVRSAGALFDGKVVWVLVELPASHITYGKDGSERHERYALVSTSHDGSAPFAVRLTDVRVECMNTISMAWRSSKAEYVVRHTANAESYVEEAKAGMARAMSNIEAMDAEIKRLLDTELDSMDFAIDVLPKVIGTRPEDTGRSQTTYDEKFGQIISLYEADHNEAISDTAWGAVNAVNEYEEWGTDLRKLDRWESQMKRMITGTYDLTRKTLALVS